MQVSASENSFANDFLAYPFDPRITYPSYKSLDDLIDVNWLKSLDECLTGYIREQIRGEKGAYFVNLYRLDKDSPYQPGVREIWLTTTASDPSGAYLDMVDDVDLWEPTAAACELPELMEFIASLPFERTGRMIIIYDASGKQVPPHRDHLNPNVCNEFIWFRTNLNKPFYVLEPSTNIKSYVNSYSCWFDAVNQYHGCDEADGLSFSLRVDGLFADELRRQIPRPQLNPASTPAYWAALDREPVTL
jgi:hypothetical protein